MEKDKILRAFEEKTETYRVSHPSTAEMDIVIFRAHCSGKNATQISMDIPCAESTVYRAIRRVKEFLQKPEIIPFIDVLKMHIANSPPNYGAWNVQSVLDMLYVAFSNYNKLAPEEAKHHLQELVCGTNRITVPDSLQSGKDFHNGGKSLSRAKTTSKSYPHCASGNSSILIKR